MGIPKYDPFRDAGDCWFDAAEAQRALDFFPTHLAHVKGPMAKRPFELSALERSVVANLFGWKRADGTRRYRFVFYYVAKKNGKTTFAAGVGVYVHFCDGEPGAECYAAATTRDQAVRTWMVAQWMIRRNPELRSRCKIYDTFKRVVSGPNFLGAVASDVDSLDGINPHLTLADELHRHRTSELLDLFESSGAARRQPIVFVTTTADYARVNSPCNALRNRAIAVRDGAEPDASFLPVICEVPADADWHDRSLWALANPSLGECLTMEFLETQYQKALQQPSFENTFKRLHLNIITQQDTRWLPMEDWAECHGLVLDPSILDGRPCWGGLDCSTTRDITAWVMAFPFLPGELDGNEKTVVALLCRFFIPRAQAREREQEDGLRYSAWERDGHVHVTEGNVIDWAFVRRQIQEDAKRFGLAEIAYDPWNASQLAQALQEEDGIQMVEFRQGYISMNEPCKNFEALVVDHCIEHFDHPVLSWMAGNVEVKVDPSNNIRPVKPPDRDANKIDGIPAAVMATARATRGDGSSVYEEKGITVI